ncbi:MAG: 2OG-Fe(II) oxygenase [Legionellales bacterium]|nr:2OG-Fe(II) oxygenase [Legionellales bacterium]
MGTNSSMQNYQSDLQTHGYAIVDNFLPENLAQELNDIYLNEAEKNWEFIDQTRENHYKHVFKTENKFCPREDEHYKAKFWRSENLEKQTRIHEIFNSYFKDKLKEISGINLQDFDSRCYRLMQGDYYRLHIDDYAGSINSIYYVNSEWIWDWGGILHVCDHDDYDLARPIFPKFNRLVLLHNKKFRSPHFISQVTEYAKNPRFSIVSFNA